MAATAEGTPMYSIALGALTCLVDSIKGFRDYHLLRFEMQRLLHLARIPALYWNDEMHSTYNNAFEIWAAAEKACRETGRDQPLVESLSTLCNAILPGQVFPYTEVMVPLGTYLVGCQIAFSDIEETGVRFLNARVRLPAILQARCRLNAIIAALSNDDTAKATNVLVSWHNLSSLPFLRHLADVEGTCAKKR